MVAPTTDDVLDALIDVHRKSGDPVADAPELAEHLDAKRRTVLDRLRRLEAAGDVESKPISSGVAFWAPSHVRVEMSRTEPLTEPEPAPQSVPIEERESAPAELPQAVREAVNQWPAPGETVAKREERVGLLVEMLLWLREHGEGFKRDFIAEFYDQGRDLDDKKDAWWNAQAKGYGSKDDGKEGGLGFVAARTDWVSRPDNHWNPWEWNTGE
ncbi:hypothetical protein [Halomarina rubra]|uniref:Uncharacterized protein n=1 Tax=Halomarina rubra TaxID=2071873 RepID=A0ABD6B2M9_9EURY|nr:hypothetical protein [Halomarina rubra]